MKKYKLNKSTLEQIKKQKNLKAEVEKAKKDLLKARQDLGQARSKNNVPDINRLEEEKHRLERKVKEEAWFLEKIKPTVPQLINDQFDAEVRPYYDLAIKEAGGKAKEAAQPFFDALAEVVRLKRERHSIASDWNEHVSSPDGIKEGYRDPGGLVAHYNGCATWAQEYTKDKPHLRSFSELMKESEDEWRKKEAVEREEGRRQDRLVKLAREYDGLTPEQAFARALAKAHDMARPGVGVKGGREIKKEFISDLEEGRKLLAERRAKE